MIAGALFSQTVSLVMSEGGGRKYQPSAPTQMVTGKIGPFSPPKVSLPLAQNFRERGERCVERGRPSRYEGLTSSLCEARLMANALTPDP